MNGLIISKEWLKNRNACKEGIEWVENNARNFESIELVNRLINEERLDWANWLIVRIMTRPQYLSYAIFAAEQVIDIYENIYTDNRPRLAITAAKVILRNNNKENRTAAAAAANAADDAAYAAANATAYAAAANAAAYASAAYAAANAAAYAANAAAADDAAYAAAYAAADAAADASAYAAAYASADADVVCAKKRMQTKILNYGLSILIKE